MPVLKLILVSKRSPNGISSVMWITLYTGHSRVTACAVLLYHNNVIKWKHFPRYWSFVRGIHRSPVNSPHKGQWRGALMFSLICVWINVWVNNREAGDLIRHRAHYDVIVMTIDFYKRFAAGDFPHIGPVMWKAFSCRDVVMKVVEINPGYL